MFAIDIMTRDGVWEPVVLLENFDEAWLWWDFARHEMGFKVRLYEWRSGA